MRANDANDRTLQVGASSPVRRREGDRSAMRSTAASTPIIGRAGRDPIVTNGRPEVPTHRKEFRVMRSSTSRLTSIDRHPRFQERNVMSSQGHPMLNYSYAEARRREMLAQAERSLILNEARAGNRGQSRIAAVAAVARRAAGAALVLAGERLQGAHRASGEAQRSPTVGTLRIAR